MVGILFGVFIQRFGIAVHVLSFVPYIYIPVMGMILDTIVQKNRQEFEMELNLVEREYGCGGKYEI